MKKVAIISLFSIVLILGCSRPPGSWMIKTPRIYSYKYKELMEAADNEDLVKMESIYKKYNLNLDYAENKYGVSLLNWCIKNHKIHAFQKLIELGADPNWQDKLRKCDAAIIEAAYDEGGTEFLAFTLTHGGNPNPRVKNGKYEIGIKYGETPLLAAIKPGNLIHVEMLVKAGADINLKIDSIPTPLAVSLIQMQYSIALYLLKNGAGYLDMNSWTVDGRKLNIIDFLEDHHLDPGCLEDIKRKEVIQFLKSKGLIFGNASR